jgi:hypothetical protein
MCMTKTRNLFVDVDECTNANYGENGGCEHHCQNAVGSYSCSCRSGYGLNNDGRRCDGT